MRDPGREGGLCDAGGAAGAVGGRVRRARVRPVRRRSRPFCGAARAAGGRGRGREVRSRGGLVRDATRRRLRGRGGVRALGGPLADGARAAGADLGPARDARLDPGAGAAVRARIRDGDRDDDRRRACGPGRWARSSWSWSIARPVATSPASCTAVASCCRSCACTCRAGRFRPMNIEGCAHLKSRASRPAGARMILAIDQGTTGTTCLVFDEQARLRSRAYREFTQHFPRPGWVEHDADEIWEVSRAVAHEALGSCRHPARAGVGRRDHQPARDGRGMGRAHRRAAAPRDRLAGPSHGRAVRRAARAGVRGARARAHRPGGRSVLLRDEDRMAAANCSRAARARRRGRRALRDDRRVAVLQAHRPRGHGLDERVAHDAVRHSHPALGRGAVRRAGRRPGGAARAGRRRRM